MGEENDKERTRRSLTFLVTGAHAFIGASIVRRLLAKQAAGVIFDRSRDARRLHAVIDDERLSRPQFVAGDITDADRLTCVVKRSAIRYIIHLAGLQVPACRANPRGGALVDVGGTINVFEAARRASDQVKKVVDASSTAVILGGAHVFDLHSESRSVADVVRESEQVGPRA